MSFPNVIFGDYGDEKVAQSAKIGNLPLGALMLLPDGRKFRLSQMGVSAMSAGQLVSTTVSVAGHGGISGSGLLASTTVTDNLAGATAVVLLAKTGAVTLDQYADGNLNVIGPAASSQIGHTYKIKSNKSCANATTLLITLEQTDPLIESASAGATLHSLRLSPYSGGLVMSTSALVAPLMGSTPVAVSASFYFWAQRGGLASLRQGVTVCVVGQPVMAASAEAGSVTAWAVSAATGSI